MFMYLAQAIKIKCTTYTLFIYFSCPQKNYGRKYFTRKLPKKGRRRN